MSHHANPSYHAPGMTQTESASLVQRAAECPVNPSYSDKLFCYFVSVLIKINLLSDLIKFNLKLNLVSCKFGLKM